ncbi:MAG: hypothetical protein M3R47_02290 [Chloroflexota bacterium]|nr:hypothetical protein [Chloroflexota bacterium]
MRTAKNILIILSDLHLSAVQDINSSHCVAREGFHYDAAFSHFIDHLLARVKSEGAECQILILGDFLDFLHTKVPLTESNLLTTTEASSLQKLKAIINAHPLVFEALKRFAATGFRLNVVPGNHDIDLMRPSVQELLKESIKTESSTNIHFHSWIYHIPRVLYAEHGHQYHDINAYTTLIAPSRRGNENELELPVGAYFDMYLFHLIEHIKPPTENINAPLRYLFNSYLKHPLKLITTFPDLCKFFYAVFRQFAYRGSRPFRIMRQKYQEKVLSSYAASTGLSYKTCVALDQLAEVNNNKMVRRLLGNALSKSDSIKSGYLYPKALLISRILRSENKEVPFYLFGHSHQPAKVALDDRFDTFYLNSGTWSSPSYPGFPGDRSLFPFVEIEWENNKRPSATLMQWDEIKQKPVQFDEG